MLLKTKVDEIKGMKEKLQVFLKPKHDNPALIEKIQDQDASEIEEGSVVDEDDVDSLTNVGIYCDEESM